MEPAPQQYPSAPPTFDDRRQSYGDYGQGYPAPPPADQPAPQYPPAGQPPPQYPPAGQPPPQYLPPHPYPQYAPYQPQYAPPPPPVQQQQQSVVVVNAAPSAAPAPVSYNYQHSLPNYIYWI